MEMPFKQQELPLYIESISNNDDNPLNTPNN